VPLKEAVRIDGALIPYLRRGGAGRPLPHAVDEYVRQYVGLVRDGKRIVYVNAMYLKMRTSVRNLGTGEFLRLCDGGAEAWGIEYDPEKKSFWGFAANAN